MRNKIFQFSRRYEAGLQRHLRNGADLKLAQRLGSDALAAGLETLALVRVHEEALRKMKPTNDSETGAGRLKEAGDFFSEVIIPLEQTHRGAREAGRDLERMNQDLRKRTADLAASNRELKEEIVRRQGIEQQLRKSERHYSRLLKESSRLQEQLRFLSHQILSTQEEERKRISRELHDQIAATLSSINLELSALRKEATGNSRDLKRKIANAQRLVQNSVEIIHRFARDLRPTTLDDLGLIPALHSFTKALSKQAGIRIRLTVFAGVEALDSARRTILYRVAQEALTNVAKHARASHAEVNIVKLNGSVCLKIKDNGKSFNVERVLYNKKNKRLGLLGMRERVEMVGGAFRIESAEGTGTTIQADFPGAHRRNNEQREKNNGKPKSNHEDYHHSAR